MKRLVCQNVQEIAAENGFIFIGAHPMAGIERSGFNFSSEKIFEGATMILTPFQGTDIADVDRLSQFFKSIGFARMQVATDVEHDQMIAYTSQLAHVVSSAYIKSELSPKFKGFSAGSFHDSGKAERNHVGRVVFGEQRLSGRRDRRPGGAVTGLQQSYPQRRWRYPESHAERWERKTPRC